MHSANELVSLRSSSRPACSRISAARAAALAGRPAATSSRARLGELTGPKAAFFTQAGAGTTDPRPGQMIQDDRFIFPSDIAFKSASASLRPTPAPRCWRSGRPWPPPRGSAGRFQLGDPDRRPHRPQLGRRSSLRIESRPVRGQSPRGRPHTGQGRSAAGAAGGGVVRRVPPAWMRPTAPKPTSATGASSCGSTRTEHGASVWPRAAMDGRPSLRHVRIPCRRASARRRGDDRDS